MRPREIVEALPFSELSVKVDVTGVGEQLDVAQCITLTRTQNGGLLGTALRPTRETADPEKCEPPEV
jgi:hypothetical protein